MDRLCSLGLNACVLSFGSSEKYGSVDRVQKPLTEDRVLKPVSPCSVSREAQKMLSWVYAMGFGCDTVITSSINRLGLGQRSQFAVSSFLQRLTRAQGDGVFSVGLRAGRTKVFRDFLEGRDEHEPTNACLCWVVNVKCAAFVLVLAEALNR